MDTSHREAHQRASKDGVKLVELQFVDIFGTVKSVTIPIEQLEDVLEHGQSFDGSSIEGFARCAGRAYVWLLHRGQEGRVGRIPHHRHRLGNPQIL